MVRSITLFHLLYLTSSLVAAANLGARQDAPPPPPQDTTTATTAAAPPPPTATPPTPEQVAAAQSAAGSASSAVNDYKNDPSPENAQKAKDGVDGALAVALGVGAGSSAMAAMIAALLGASTAAGAAVANPGPLTASELAAQEEKVDKAKEDASSEATQQPTSSSVSSTTSSIPAGPSIILDNRDKASDYDANAMIQKVLGGMRDMMCIDPNKFTLPISTGCPPPPLPPPPQSSPDPVPQTPDISGMVGGVRCAAFAADRVFARPAAEDAISKFCGDDRPPYKLGKDQEPGLGGMGDRFWYSKQNEFAFANRAPQSYCGWWGCPNHHVTYAISIRLHGEWSLDQKDCPPKQDVWPLAGNACKQIFYTLMDSCNTDTTTNKLGGSLTQKTAFGCIDWEIVGHPIGPPTWGSLVNKGMGG